MTGWRIRAKLCGLLALRLRESQSFALRQPAIGAAGQGLERPRAKWRLRVGMTSANIAR